MFRDELIEFLLQQPYASYITSKTEIKMRCPFCGDSIKHENSTHLYIKVDVGEKEPFVYYCQRCNAKGIIGREFFKELKCRDMGIILSSINYNKGVSSNNKRRSIHSVDKVKLLMPDYEDNKLNRVKLNYINKRIGTNLSYSDLKNFKITLNLKELLKANNVTKTSVSNKFIDSLDHNFIGFSSFDNKYLIMRNLSNKVLPDIRYYNYNVFNLVDNSKRFYVIPSSLNLKSPFIKIVLAEGVFDILSVYHNIPLDKENTIFAAVGGVGYSDVIKQLIRYTGILNFELSIYGDNDKDEKFYKSLLNNNTHLMSEYTLYRNSLEKDFGVPIDRIKINTKIIK